MRSARCSTSSVSNPLSVERDGDFAKFTLPRHWAREQRVEHALREAGLAWEGHTVDQGTRFDIVAPRPKRRFRVLVTRHPLDPGYYLLELPGLPMACWGHAQPEGPASRGMAEGLINVWQGLKPDEVELDFEYVGQ